MKNKSSFALVFVLLWINMWAIQSLYRDLFFPKATGWLGVKHQLTYFLTYFPKDKSQLLHPLATTPPPLPMRSTTVTPPLPPHHHPNHDMLQEQFSDLAQSFAGLVCSCAHRFLKTKMQEHELQVYTTSESKVPHASAEHTLRPVDISGALNNATFDQLYFFLS